MQGTSTSETKDKCRSGIRQYSTTKRTTMTKSITTSLSAVLLACSFACAESETPPNVVLILSDDQGYTDYGFMGHPEIETPNLDKLAKESALFRHGYVPTALCRPSLMTLVAGPYSHQNKTTGNDPRNTPANKAHVEKAGINARTLLISHIDKTGSLPNWLAEKGHVSHQSGKWWEGSYQRGGFTERMTRGFPADATRLGLSGRRAGPVQSKSRRLINCGKPCHTTGQHRVSQRHRRTPARHREPAAPQRSRFAVHQRRLPADSNYP